MTFAPNVSISRRAAAGRIGLAAAAAAFAAVAPAGAQTPIRLRVGAVANDFATPLLYAIDAGMFRDAGLEIEPQFINTGTAVAAALAGNSIDLGIASTFALVNAHARGVPLTLIAGGTVYLTTSPAVGVLALANGPVRTPADLSGKTVSSPALNDILAVSMRGWADKAGGHSETMQFVELSGTQIGQALEAGRVAAAGVANPTLAGLLAGGKFRNLGDPSIGIASRFMATGWVATTDYVQKNPSIVRTFAAVIAKAATFANTHPEQTAPVLAKYSGFELPTVLRMTRAKFEAALDARDVQPVIDAAAKYKAIPRNFEAREIMASLS